MQVNYDKTKEMSGAQPVCCGIFQGECDVIIFASNKLFWFDHYYFCK